MLQGKLIRLRPVEERDIDHYFSWINDPELARLVIGSIELGARNRMLKTLEESLTIPDINCSFMIETVGGEELIGFCLLKNIHTIHRSAELEQFFIGEKKFRDKGYGQDALQTLLNYAFGELNLNRIWLITYGYNKEAITFYEKEGFVQEGLLRQIQFTQGKFHDGVIMGILKKDWFTKNSINNLA